MNKQKIADLAQKAIDTFNLPSLGIGVYHKAESFSHVYGQAEQDNLYPLASISKTFFATAVCQLADEGKINLDDPLKKSWPELKLEDKYAEDHLTWRDALSHQSGLPAHDLMRFTNMNKHDLSLKEKAEHVGHLKPNHELRYKMQYSNLVFALATHAFEQVIGEDYGTYEHQHLLEPLKLTRTYINHHEAPREDIVKPYIRDNGITEEVPFIAPGKVGGASSMLSSISDLLTWAEYQLKLQKENKNNAIAEHFLPQSIMAPSRAYGGANFGAYGLGMMMEDYRGHKYFYHSGSYIGYCSFMGFVPDLDLAFVSTTNMDSTDAIFALAYQTIDDTLGISDTDWTSKIKQIVDQKLATREENIAILKGKSPKNFAAKDNLLGDYENPGYGLITLNEKDGNLTVTIGKWDYPVIVNEKGKMYVEERLYQHELLPIEIHQNQVLLWTERALKEPTTFTKL